MKRIVLAALAVSCLPLASAPALTEAPARYSVPAQPWPVEMGHHRARVEVEAPAEVVQAHLPWRVQFGGNENHRIIVVEAASGKEVANVVRASATRLAGDILFEAREAGEYFIYYLPLRPYQHMNDVSGYVPYSCSAEAGWRESHGLTDADLRARAWSGKFPLAKLVDFQARSELDRLDPMAVIASPEETSALVGNDAPPIMVFPEDRARPIRMKHDLPLRWIQSGPSNSFAGEARQNEYYAFQIGLYAPKQALQQVVVSFSDLCAPGGSTIPASALTCFNTGGLDSKGRPFSKTVNIPPGHVQALWCGIDVAADQAPGIYQGNVTVGAQNAAPVSVALRLAVEAGPIPERGDNEPWRHSRLRWLNSTAGTEGTIPPPYTPLTIEGGRVSCLGRVFQLGGPGLPDQVTAGPAPALAAPVRFVVEAAGGPLAFKPSPLRWVKQSPARAEWIGESVAAGAALTCAGELEYDGHVRYRLELKATADLDLRDIRLELPMRPEAAAFLLGAGYAGGSRPPDFSWNWQGPFNSFWLGSVEVGLQCKLLGGTYTGPMLNLYHPAPPASWHNGGKGGLTVREREGVVVASAFSGPRKLAAGQSLVFEFSLLATPVKPLDTREQFRTRFYHGCDNWLADGTGMDPIPPDEIFKTGVNVVNIHHASIYNPYINYPFLRTTQLRALTDRLHPMGVRVKIYDTVRELSNMVTEIWALRSLGDEVYAHGGGGGYAWCQEQLIDGYQPSWFQRFGEAPPDASMVTNGDSRWFNYYVEGMGWLARHTGLDGLYLDDVSYDRRILQRVRAVLARENPKCLIDLHSNTGFSIGSANHYMEFMPYLDRTWFGESFRYEALTPDQWLVQVSGIPFGVMGEMLQAGGHPWRGAVFGLTNRLGWHTENVVCDPRPVWKIWDRFGIVDSEMIGWWNPACPVQCENPATKATVFRKQGAALIALANWSEQKTEGRLRIDWKALGLDPAKAVLFAPRSPGFQKFGRWKPGELISVPAGRGWLILVDEAGPVAGKDDADTMSARPVLLDEAFASKTPDSWQTIVSSRSGTSVKPTPAGIEIAAEANIAAGIERPWVSGAGAVECTLDTGTDRGETWGLGLSLVWADGREVRLNARVPESRFGVDVKGQPQKFPGKFIPGEVRFRFRLDPGRLIGEAACAAEDEEWQELVSLDRKLFPEVPATVRVGKEGGSEGFRDNEAPGAPGKSTVKQVRWYR